MISLLETAKDKIQEGPIRCIFFSEFHHIAGPKITCQVPDNFVSKDIFDNVNVYIIPKAQLQRSTITVLAEMLGHVMQELNLHKMCTLTEGTMTSHLKVVKLAPEPKPVLDHQVPIFLEGKEAFHSDQWDLTTQQVLPYIDGFNHVARIAAEADVENNLVKSCVQNLAYYSIVTLIPIFQYSNVYAATPKLKQLAEDIKLQERCITYASKSPRQPAYLRDIYRMYASMTHSCSMRDLCQRLNPQNLRINERRLVQFGLIEGLIRRVYKYPILLPGIPYNEETRNNPIYKYFTGTYNLDEICCNTGQSVAQIEEIVERDPNIVMLWK
ncbi:GATOR complex protein NPRL2 isoform X5 [Vespa velutina]|uniref:GATOR complex protein NPRL2 isoform X5 n=1 Tax=Vespa velutina TaxID=202808 RepID=UPI001FB31EA0|nr:GATOR complex protein NPRL2 isoform X5 [Vespa velutina]